MPTQRENQDIRARPRRVLEMLAKEPRGRDVNALLTCGFTFETLADLVRSSLATVRVENKSEPPSPTVEVARLRITDAGRRMIEDQAKSE